MPPLDITLFQLSDASRTRLKQNYRRTITSILFIFPATIGAAAMFDAPARNT